MTDPTRNAGTPATPTTPFDYFSRDQLLTLIGPDDAARVSTAEAQARVEPGEDYLDLHHLDHGIRTANGNAPTIHNVLPRRLVDEPLWLKILAQIAQHQHGNAAARAEEQRGPSRHVPSV